jgi:signal transduction histidine kinase
VTTRFFALLVLLTIVPAAFVLWFMNAAVSAENESAQQRVREAYRGQLRLIRERLDPLWRAQAMRLGVAGAPAERFDQLATNGVAEGVVVLDAAGAVVFPDGDARRRLQQMDAQRARDANVFLPTQAALRLSIELADAERPSPLPGTFRETTIAGVWALSSDDGRVIGLYRTGRLEAMMHDFLHQVETGAVAFIAIPPGEPADGEAIAAGAWLPGWQLTYVPLTNGAPVAGETRQRTVYVAVALAGVVLIALIGAGVAAGLRGHLRLARLKTDLVAAASHELRTPLASTAVLVDGLLADPAPDPVRTREYLQLIAAENTRLSRLVDNFLTFARVDRGSLRLAFGPVDAAAVVRAAIDSVGRRIPDAGALRVEVPADLPLVADEDALRGALVNLIDNALKYTAEDKRIVVRAQADGADHVRFEVIDNGIGIPPREHRRIFRRFHRMDDRLSQQTTGVGLGLSIVEAIVRAHGGTVSVESTPGAGSTFALRLPCLPPGAAA